MNLDAEKGNRLATRLNADFRGFTPRLPASITCLHNGDELGSSFIAPVFVYL